jgi:hypothetical protein
MRSLTTRPIPDSSGAVDIPLPLLITAKDIAAYEAFFLDHLAEFPGVQSDNSSIVLKAMKETTAVPIPHRPKRGGRATRTHRTEAAAHRHQIMPKASNAGHYRSVIR